MRIKRITIAVPRRFFDCVLLAWALDEGDSGVVLIGGVWGVGIIVSGDGSRGVGAGGVILFGLGVVPIFEGVKGMILVTVVPEDGGRVPTVQPVPVVSQ